MLFNQEEAFRDESARRRAKRDTFNWGVTYLDHCLGSPIGGDLILVGAESGCGKSELLVNFTYRNAKLGKKVGLVYLEGFTNEVAARQKFKVISSMYYSQGRHLETGMIYFKPWIKFEYGTMLDDLELKAEQYIYDNGGDNVFVKYKDRAGFSIDDLKRLIDEIKHTVDILVIDHLHYFDIRGANENYETMLIAKELKATAEQLDIPIVCAVHLRERPKKTEHLIPAKEDIHGTSNLYKISTGCVILAKYRGEPQPEETYLHPTMIRVDKDRLDSSTSWFAGIHTFNSRTNTYENGYTLGKLKNWDTEFEPIVTDYRSGDYEAKRVPHWAKEKDVKQMTIKM